MIESERALLSFEQLFDTSRSIYKKQKMILETVLEPFDITVLQYLLMFKIHKSGSTALSRLALSLDLKPASVTRMTDILYKRRLMVRSDYHDDRRVVMIQLTEEGEELLQKAAVQYAEKAAGLYRQLNTAELQYLRKLAESLTKLANGCAVKNGK
ncbi:MarR family transcriptional regulator [Bacillus sp. ISL-51]|uniref:MarR family transcriptional regulator n=1 Tax=Bacteria TaxID=2 RepID=UPI001BEB3A97|nr:MULTISPECIES: MarR family transcriptional regulator [unclassified Bacillus (in: firmicutes)]MBT2575528.1 MarR family transcriptional regulator [Bacillus sp. ISL-51]MBT2635204.1 MarR family transcriptional regulator [Bacillus sp. ISL-26]MBT2711387.1 MarR family transcriptional regulator [Pseudomonas sp. ISL-88]